MQDFIYGADLSWVSQLESQGVCWIDESGDPTDPLEALQAMGVNAVRLRVFVDPPKDAYWDKPQKQSEGKPVGGERCMLGFCDPESVLAMAERVKRHDMQLMIDFHYSDHFADPVFQDIPAAWAHDGYEEMCGRVAAHTEEVLRLLTTRGICPEWVQVGNEIESGLLLPLGSATEQPQQMAGLLNAGYDAVKACCPSSSVVTHINCGNDYERCARFFDTFFGHGGRTNMLAVSHYPYWTGIAHDEQVMQDNLTKLSLKYGRPVMISEIGGPEREAEETYALLTSAVRALQNVPAGLGRGIFYWEPEVGASLLPDHYPLGAAEVVSEKRLRFTRAMRAYADSRSQTGSGMAAVR